MKNRLLSALLALCMALTLLPAAAFAEGEGGGAELPMVNVSLDENDFYITCQEKGLTVVTRPGAASLTPGMNGTYYLRFRYQAPEGYTLLDKKLADILSAQPSNPHITTVEEGTESITICVYKDGQLIGEKTYSIEWQDWDQVGHREGHWIIFWPGVETEDGHRVVDSKFCENGVVDQWPDDLVQEGYEFAGWKKLKSGLPVGNVVTKETIGTLTEFTELTAVWDWVGGKDELTVTRRSMYLQALYDYSGALKDDEICADLRLDADNSKIYGTNLHRYQLWGSGSDNMGYWVIVTVELQFSKAYEEKYSPKTVRWTDGDGQHSSEVKDRSVTVRLCLDVGKIQGTVTVPLSAESGKGDLTEEEAKALSQFHMVTLDFSNVTLYQENTGNTGSTGDSTWYSPVTPTTPTKPIETEKPEEIEPSEEAPKPEPTPANELFTDVAENAWYVREVSYVVENRLMTGTGNGQFDPEGAATRAQVAAMLTRFCESIKE